MGFWNKAVTCLLLIASTFAVSANEEPARQILLQDIETLAVDKPLQYDNGEPVAVIDTGVIADSLGRVARGPHSFEFSLEETAPFAVMVRGERVEPGTTLNFVENLTAVNSRLILPIYPAELGLGGKAKFELDLPELFIRACPVGYTEGENDCFNISYDEMTYICPTSETTYRQDTSDCRGIRVTPSIPYCDAPFELNNGTCVHTFTTSAYENCPTGNGWTQNGTTCEYFEQRPIQSCPSGYTQRDNLCYQIIDKRERCDTGYNIKDGLCKKSECTSADPVCPSGYTLSGSSCTKVESRSATPYCPSGYTRSGSTCSKTETRTASGSCPSGYSSYSSTKCKKSSTYTASEACPSGYTLFDWFEPHYCYKTTYKTPYRIYCDAEFHTKSVENGTTYCTNPFMSKKYIARKDCPSGYSGATSDRCSKTSKQDVSYSCPNGGSVSGSTCTKTSYRDKSFSCPSGYSRSGTTCTRTRSTSASYSCPSGYALSGTTCKRTVSISADYTCPSGWTVSGTSCLRTLTQSIDYYCGSGEQELNNTNCFKTDASTTVGNCPSGYDLNTSTGACEASDSQPVTYSCPTENGDKYTLQSTECHYADMQAATPTCDGEATLIDDGASCELKLIDEAIPSCEQDGYIPVVSEERCMLDERVPFGQ